MAIEPVMAEMIRGLRNLLPNNRVLCLGYPDIFTTGEPPTDAERQQIAKWHHWKGGIEDAGHFFGKQDLDAEYWDVTQARGPERVINLNYAQMEYEYHFGSLVYSYETVCSANTFGLIIDPGTIEHIANIGNCWRTLCAVTALNGIVIHSNPLTMANHGFYSIHPTAYLDLYEANGFKVESLTELSGPLDNRTIRDVNTTHRFQPSQNAVVMCVARKARDVPFTWPIQSKYRANPTLKAAQ
jgi:hypothetical protein